MSLDSPVTGTDSVPKRRADETTKPRPAVDPDIPPNSSDGRPGLWWGMGFFGVVVLGCVILAPLGLVVTAMLNLRENARRNLCASHLKNLSLAVHNYEAQHGRFPPLAIGPATSAEDGLAVGRLSWYVHLLPHLDQASVYQQIDRDAAPPPDDRFYDEVGKSLARDAVCPSDGSVPPDAYTVRSYRANLGQFVLGNDQIVTAGLLEDERFLRTRGPFVRGYGTRQNEITDGLGATLMLGEAVIDGTKRTIAGRVAWNLGDAPDELTFRNRLVTATVGEDGQLYNDLVSLNLVDLGPGTRWADGAPYFSGFTSVLPPNRASGMSGRELSWGILTPTSRHLRGAQFSLMDGAVTFLSGEIDEEVFRNLGSQADGFESLVPAVDSEP